MMNRKLSIGVAALLALAILGYAATMGNKPPSVAALREDPALFQMSDYKYKAELHTRLSSLFQRGSSRKDIENFFKAAGLNGNIGETAQCTYSLDYDTMRFVMGLSDNQLRSIHIRSEETYWPAQTEICREASRELTPVDISSEQPIHLPLEPLDIE